MLFRVLVILPPVSVARALVDDPSLGANLRFGLWDRNEETPIVFDDRHQVKQTEGQDAVEHPVRARLQDVDNGRFDERIGAAARW